MSNESLRDRLKRQREELRSSSNKGNMIFLKADTEIRVRILKVSEDEEFAVEVQQFYLGEKLKSVISPASIGEPCALMEGYDELKASKDTDDKDVAKSFTPKKRFVMLVAKYKDLKGKEFESEEEKFVVVTPGMYQDILDLYLDENDWGDMTDPKEGYDLKLSRMGSGKTDTEYSVTPLPKSELKKPFAKKVYNVREEVKKIMPSYEETKRLLSEFLGTPLDDDEEEKKPKTKVKKIIKK